MDISEFVKTVAEGLGAVEILKRLISKLPDPKDKDEAEGHSDTRRSLSRSHRQRSQGNRIPDLS